MFIFYLNRNLDSDGFFTYSVRIQEPFGGVKPVGYGTNGFSVETLALVKDGLGGGFYGFPSVAVEQCPQPALAD